MRQRGSPHDEGPALRSRPVGVRGAGLQPRPDVCPLPSTRSRSTDGHALLWPRAAACHPLVGQQPPAQPRTMAALSPRALDLPGWGMHPQGPTCCVRVGGRTGRGFRSGREALGICGLGLPSAAPKPPLCAHRWGLGQGAGPKAAAGLGQPCYSSLSNHHPATWPSCYLCHFTGWGTTVLAQGHTANWQCLWLS